MKEVKEGITTLLIVFMVCGLVDFEKPGWQDYGLFVLLALYLVILIIDVLRRGGKKHAKR